MRRAVLVATVAATIAATALVLPAPAWAAVAATTAPTDSAGLAATRYGGADRYETSLRIAEAVAAEADGSLSSVVLVSGERWTDAVVAAPIAGSLGAPVLMTPPGELRTDALRFLQRTGVVDAVVIGPEASGAAHGPGRGVGAAVLTELSDAGISAQRVTGPDRYATSVAAAEQVTSGEMPGKGRTAIVASGEIFADALVAGPFAARGIHPVLLSAPDELPAAVASYLGAGDIEHVVVMGGNAALSAEVEEAITDLGLEVTRLAGKSRYDTAVKAAELVTGRYSATAGQNCFATSTVGLARARVPFDSFSAAPLLGRLCAPLVLADPKQIPADTAAYFDAAREANAEVDLRVFGGNAAVSQAAIDAYLAGEDGGDASESDGQEQGSVPAGLAAGTCGGSVHDEARELLDSDDAQDPAWSPDCSRIVYSDRSELWTMNNDGTNPQRLTAHDGSHADGPSWSPDGSQIAYTRGQRNDDGHWFSHIYVVNADGTGRTNVSKGDVWDAQPSWSPDGVRIAFQRRSGEARDSEGNFTNQSQRIMVTNADGTGLVTLTTGSVWYGSPAWSPDGNRIAYVAQGVIWLVDPDGSNAERVIGGAFSEGGLSWSPDGRRIAFVRGDWDEASIVIADLDRPGELAVADLGGFNALPKWSPDGDRIAFTRYPEGRLSATRSAYVTGASGTPTGLGSGCRPRGIENYSVGFPLSEWAIPSTGVLRVAVLFMDFPDAEAAVSLRDEAAEGLQLAEEYMEAVSYGLLDVEFVPHYHWLRADRSYRQFLGVNRVLGEALNDEAGALAVQIADPDFDFADFEAVITVFPRSHFKYAVAGSTVTADGNTMRNPLINFKPLDGPPHGIDARQWGHAAAHELVHGLGLLDLYPYDFSAHEQPQAPSGHEWVGTKWGLMDLWAWYLADSTDQRLRHTWRHPSGRTDTGYNTRLEPLEMLAWSRWQLGWLDESQVLCIEEDDSSATVALTPIAQPGDGIAMAAIQLSPHEVIVIESRRSLGFDRPHARTQTSGWRTEVPNLAAEGVLVYTVDSFVDTGELPLKIAGDSGNGQVDDFPVLQPGESVTVRGYTITVTADDGDTHTVTIAKAD